MAAKRVLISLCVDIILAIVFLVHTLFRLFAQCHQLKPTTIIILAVLSQHLTTPAATTTMTEKKQKTLAMGMIMTTEKRKTTTTTTRMTTMMIPDSRCSINSGIVVDQTSCSAFLLCFKGRVRPVSCGRDLLFNRQLLTCDLPHKVHCGTRPRKNGVRNFCYTAKVKVTLNIRNGVREPRFEKEIKVQAPRQSLRYILLIAAGMDPMFRYQTHNFEGYGDYVISINGVSNDVTKQLAAWQVHSKHYGLVVDNLDDFIPEDNDVITFIYMDALEQRNG